MPEATLTFPDKKWSAAIYGLASKCLLVGKPETTTGVHTKVPKDRSQPHQRYFIRQTDKLPPLDLQSWISVIPLVFHVSECSTIRKAFGFIKERRQWRRDINAGGKKRKSMLKAKPGYCSSVQLDNLMANGWKTKSL
jgi:hypothetical protein